ARRQHYDDWLWRYRTDSFLPHGQDGDPQAEGQPVWLSTSDDAPNNASMALVVEGAELPPLEKFKLLCLMFSSENEVELERSRSLWRSLKCQKTLSLTYWQQQENGAWAKANV